MKEVLAKMRVTNQRAMEKAISGFNLKTASRPGGYDLITLVDRLNSSLKWPSAGISKQEVATRGKMVKRVHKEIVQDVGLILEALQGIVSKGWQDGMDRDQIFGVPSFVFAQRLYWGQDRMHFLRDAVIRKTGAH